MSTAALLVEAVDTLATLIRAAFGWLIFLAVTASILALAAVACGAWGALYGRWRGADGREDVPEPQEPPRVRTGRRVPSWAHTDHHRYDEAA